jgi:hypothetical protein
VALFFLTLHTHCNDLCLSALQTLKSLGQELFLWFYFFLFLIPSTVSAYIVGTQVHSIKGTSLLYDRFRPFISLCPH